MIVCRGTELNNHKFTSNHRGWHMLEFQHFERLN